MNKEQNDNVNDSNSPKDIFGDDWQTLTKDWQSQPYKKSDIDALLKRTKRRTYGAKAMLTLDVLATLLLIVASIIGLRMGDWGVATLSYLITGSLLSMVFVYFEFKIRLGAWKKACDSPERAIENALRGCESSLKYIKLIKRSCWLLAGLFSIFAIVFSQELGKPELMWPMLIELNFIVVTCFVITHWFQRKRMAEYKRLQTMQSK